MKALLRRPHLRTVVVPVLLAAAAGCTEDLDPGQDEAAILGGNADPADNAMVGIANLDGADVCSGVLLAPGLVLAAQRCVAAIASPGACAGETFGAARPPDHFFITTRTPMTQMPGDYHEVTEIRTPPGGSGVCGRDLVLLRLISLVGAAEGTPITPFLDSDVTVGEHYASIGYGGTADTGAGGGQRRRLDDLSVACLGAACASASIGAGEWKGGASVCPGDQGGPALDGSNRVLSIASRGGAGCTDSIYTSLAPYKDWLVQETIRAAMLGGYPAPAWTGS
ncbi:MAG TPA: trypsin-like serine protease, partial [Kofleriaceae bacterium]|nr:trypsin-like serine protease [Kofleriaceae bacterium]